MRILAPIENGGYENGPKLHMLQAAMCTILTAILIARTNILATALHATKTNTTIMDPLTVQEWTVQTQATPLRHMLKLPQNPVIQETQVPHQLPKTLTPSPRKDLQLEAHTLPLPLILRKEGKNRERIPPVERLCITYIFMSICYAIVQFYFSIQTDSTNWLVSFSEIALVSII